MNNIFTFLQNKYFFLYSIFPIIFLFITFHNPYYSDDYQTILGLKLYNLIEQQSYFSLFDVFKLRSDGHLNPILYYSNQFFPENFYFIHSLIVLVFYLSILVLHKVLENLNFPKELNILSCFIYSSFFIFVIKPLVWNVFHSHITNSFTGLLAILFLLKFIDKKKLKYYILYLLLSFLTIFNSESGLIYPFICFFIIFLLKNVRDVLSYLYTSIPLIFYFSISYYLSLNSPTSTLIENRVLFDINFFSLPDMSNGIKSLILEYRSRNSPNNFFGYSFIFIDNILNILNISTYEYIFRSFKNNLFKLFLAIIFCVNFFFILKYLLTFFLESNFIKDKSFFNYFILLIICLFVYTFIFHRKDICILLGIFASINYSIIYNFFKNKYDVSKGILFVSIIIFPSIIYAFTGFEEVYEMRSRSYIKEMSLIHYSNINNHYLNQNIPYFEDFMVLYCLKNYEKFKNNLSDFKSLDVYQFENNFTKYVNKKYKPCSSN